MTPERRIAAAFRMDEAAWARHANPWSGWTRLPSLPLLALAAWSRAWIGWWALPAVAAVLAWIWVNPRLFPPPRRMDAWMTRAVLGERIWLARDAVPVPLRHRRIPNILTGANVAGVAVAAYGLAVLDPWATVFGVAIATLAKMWFLDRMVRLHHDMTKDTE
ncbi:DUF6653 family protein [Roseomonas sp. HF4]|uniref:DUF6653 family protein n=1 Tax=Roseomonas sp. HF4 TaxID=2562313 RepID=UPI0010C0EC2C|nr:DUF6653 family protein [Roseomonas sp. HF4]